MAIVSLHISRTTTKISCFKQANKNIKLQRAKDVGHTQEQDELALAWHVPHTWVQSSKNDSDVHIFEATNLVVYILIKGLGYCLEKTINQ